MAESTSPLARTRESRDDILELNNDLDRMTEVAENLSVQLTWMAYDMVALRTRPDSGDSMRKLEEAYRRCVAAVYGDQESETDNCPEPDGQTTLTQM